MPDVKCSCCRTRGSTYLGSCDVYGRRHGFGAENWRTQEQKYEGSFVRDAFHGEGAYQWFTGKERLVFEGQFYSNFKEGYGLVSLADGSVFEGLFCNNRPFGPGVQTHVNGRQDVGFWCGNRIVRLSRSVDFIVPRLASTSAGKLKLLQFQAIVPCLEDDADVAAALLIKHGLDPSQSHRLYSNLIHDPRSMFFNRPHLDKVYFVKVDGTDSSSVSSGRYARSENSKAGVSSDDCVVPDSRQSNDCGPPCADAEECEENSAVGVLRFHATHRTLYGYPTIFPGERDATLTAESEHKLDVVSDAENDRGVTQLLSWNRGELCMEMLKQIFRFRSFEEKVTFRISDLMAGARTKFHKTGESERLCLHFLKMCSIGPAYIIRDLLCSRNISEALMDARGNSSIMFAAASDQHDIIDLLLNYGADVNSFNDENLTPLNLCLLRRIAEAESLGNWEVSFLAPDRPVRDAEEVKAKKTWRAAESIASLDRIFGDGMSANDGEVFQVRGDSAESGSVFLFDDEDSQDISGATVLKYKPNAGERDAASRKSLSYTVGNAKGTAEVDVGGICPTSFKREEYLKSVAEPTEQDKYFFDLSTDGSRRVEEVESRKSAAGVSAVQSKQFDQPAQNSFTTRNDRICNIDRTIEQLLRRGADPNIGDAPKPSLHLAVHSKDLCLVRLLLTYGAAPDSQTLPQEGLLTPLHVVVLMKPGEEQIAICEVLLNHGASPEEETAADFTPNGENDSLLDPEHGRTPLQLLCTRQDAKYVDPEGFLSRLALLLVRVSKRGHFFRGHSYLTLAMIYGNYALVEALLTSKRVDPNQVLGSDLGTALHVLVSTEYQKATLFDDSIQMCDLLLDHGANPNQKFRTPRSLAGTCVDYGYREIERERNRERISDSALTKSGGRHYLEDHIRVVEYLEKRAKYSDKEGSREMMEGRFGVEGDRRRTSGSRWTREENSEDATGEWTMRKSEDDGMGIGRNERGNVAEEVDARGGVRDKIDVSTRRSDERTEIIEIKKHVEKGNGREGRKARGGKDSGKGKGTKADGTEGTWRGGRKQVDGQQRSSKKAGERQDLLKGKRSPRGMDAGGSERLPERFRQSLLQMFGVCGERLRLNDFLLPYVVLRNGDLYYRFNGRKPAGTEQYSLM